jgi:hypothetical protein
VPLGGRKAKILYLRSGTLMAQDFGTAKLQLAGESAPVAEGVGNSLVFGFYAASPTTLAYRTRVEENIQLQWIDRQGKPGPGRRTAHNASGIRSFVPGWTTSAGVSPGTQIGRYLALGSPSGCFPPAHYKSGHGHESPWSPDGKQYLMLGNNTTELSNCHIALAGSPTRTEPLQLSHRFESGF